MSPLSSEIIESSGDVLEKAGKTDRTLFIGVMVAVLIFVGYISYLYSTSQKEQRDAFLLAMEKRDEKFTEAMDRNSEALRRNTEATIELKALIK